jgi:hypothetical protein
LQVALGQDVGHVPVLAASEVAFYLMIVAPEWATQLESIEGVDGLKSLPGVEQVSLNRAPGDPLNSRRSPFKDHVLRLDGLAASHAALAELVHEAIPATVRIGYS